MYFNLIIIGDEILHGSRIDKHFVFFKSLLEKCGFNLGQVQYLPDDRQWLTKQLRRSFSDGLPTFVTGGIGATPDDHTRQAAAEALNTPLVLHEEASALIEKVSLQRGDSLDSATHLQRLKMAEFPKESTLIPNHYNQIAGFSIRQHYFLPGFPVMAHPMAEWVLSTYYAQYFHKRKNCQRQIYLFDIAESKLVPLMHEIEAIYPGIRTFSLPSVGKPDGTGRFQQPHIEFGLKAENTACESINEAWAYTLDKLQILGCQMLENHENSK